MVMDREKWNQLSRGRQLWIYGIGRWQKDFEYVFRELSITGYIDNRLTKKSWQEKPLFTMSSFKEAKKSTDVLVICCLPPKSITNGEKEYIQNGFLGYECVWAEELFFLLDDEVKDLIGAKEILVWGTGRIAEKIWPELVASYQIAYFIDSRTEKNNFHGFAVKKFSDALIKEKDIFIVIANSYYREISALLLEQGLKEGIDFCHYERLCLPSKLMLEVWNDESFYNLSCTTMLHHLDIIENGRLNCCCTTFMRESLGSLLERDVREMWNSRWHRILCVSILNHTFCFCRQDLCPALVNKIRERYKECFKEEKYQEVEGKPSSVNICIDHSCNLFCKSCRNRILMADAKQLETARQVAARIERDILPFADFIMLAGNGEVFLSQIYRSLWQSAASKKAKYFQLLSNGNLFTEKIWQEFSKGRQSEVLLCVSIDAGTEETYKKIRRGGNWEKLMQNMRFAGDLREKGKIAYFRLNFVVQRENYKEIPQFIELAKSIHADRVLFTRILNWGTYSAEEFSTITMVDEHGAPKPELREILDLPICQDSIVDMGTFNWTHGYWDDKQVGSYYLWEIDNYSDMNIEKNVLG